MSYKEVRMKSDLYYIKKGLSLYGRRAYDTAVSKGVAVILRGNRIYSVTSKGERILRDNLPQSEVKVERRSYSLKRRKWSVDWEPLPVQMVQESLQSYKSSKIPESIWAFFAMLMNIRKILISCITLVFGLCSIPMITSQSMFMWSRARWVQNSLVFCETYKE